MAFPFGGHPRLGEYIAWAQREHSCSSQSGFSKVEGHQETFVLIENPGNQRHVIIYAGWNEFLAPSMVSHLDRRLGVHSPFPKMPTLD